RDLRGKGFNLPTDSSEEPFYQNLWQKGLPKGEALHQARLKLLHQNRADFKGDAMPSTWGAFVLSGDWN
ncbi:MAG: CHAT domain-containing protein, partial [Planctomycetes bacterium]|nr:CHAT domain-containing protein [Planctomycetota bacterium]